MRDNGFTPVGVGRALYLPPTNSRISFGSSTLERIGDRWFQRFAGAVLIEARKQIYEARPVRPKKVARTRPVLVTLPQVARREPPAG